MDEAIPVLCTPIGLDGVRRFRVVGADREIDGGSAPAQVECAVVGSEAGD